MAKQQPSTDWVRFQLSQFPDLAPLADRVLESGEGRGGLVREIRRLVRLGMAAEQAGLGMREAQALADGRLQVSQAGAGTGLSPIVAAAARVPVSAQADASLVPPAPAGSTFQHGLPAPEAQATRSPPARRLADNAHEYRPPTEGLGSAYDDPTLSAFLQ